MGSRTDSGFQSNGNFVAGPQMRPWHGPMPQRVSVVRLSLGEGVGYALDLTAEALALFDKEGERKNYLMLQEILNDVRLTERASMGRQFHTVAGSMRGKTSGFTMACAVRAKCFGASSLHSTNGRIMDKNCLVVTENSVRAGNAKILSACRHSLPEKLIEATIQ